MKFLNLGLTSQCSPMGIQRSDPVKETNKCAATAMSKDQIHKSLKQLLKPPKSPPAKPTKTAYELLLVTFVIMLLT